MNSSRKNQETDASRSDIQALLTDQLINKILTVTATTTVIAFCAAEIRAFTTGMGWAYRDLIQFSVVGLIVALAYFCRRLHLQFKAISLILLLSIGSVSGAGTLGMLAGTVWIFPLILVIVAVLYSKLATRIYIGLTLAFFIFVATRFCTEKVILPFNPDRLLSNPYNWFVYILCLATSLIVACVAIQNYREKMKNLVDKIGRQSDELKKSNESLLKALDDVKTLSGMLPICGSCKKIRDDKGYWSQIEIYLQKHSEAKFSHGLCPECSEKLYGDKDWYIEMKKKKGDS